jgi:hypothetical protein
MNEEMNTEMNNVEKRCANSKCNKILDININGKRKYCSEICRTRVSARRQYNKFKDNADFIKDRNERSAKYYEQNKEKLKPVMRVYGMKYYFRKRDEKLLKHNLELANNIMLKQDETLLKDLSKENEIQKESINNENTSTSREETNI